MSILKSLNPIDSSINKYNINDGLFILNQTINNFVFLKYKLKTDFLNMNVQNITDTNTNFVSDNSSVTNTETNNDTSNNIFSITLQNVDNLINKNTSIFSNGINPVLKDFILKNKKQLKTIIKKNDVYKIEISSNSIILYQKIKTNENENDFDKVINNNIKLIVEFILNLININNDINQKNIYIKYCENNSKYSAYNVYNDTIKNIIFNLNI